MSKTNLNMTGRKHLAVAKCGAGAEVYRWFRACVAKMEPTNDPNAVKAMCDALKSLRYSVGKMVDDGEEEKVEEVSTGDLMKELEGDGGKATDGEDRP